MKAMKPNGLFDPDIFLTYLHDKHSFVSIQRLASIIADPSILYSNCSTVAIHLYCSLCNLYYFVHLTYQY